MNIMNHYPLNFPLTTTHIKDQQFNFPSSGNNNQPSAEKQGPSKRKQSTKLTNVDSNKSITQKKKINSARFVENTGANASTQNAKNISMA